MRALTSSSYLIFWQAGSASCCLRICKVRRLKVVLCATGILSDVNLNMGYLVDFHVIMLHKWHGDLRVWIVESCLPIESNILTGVLNTCCILSSVAASMHSRANSVSRFEGQQPVRGIDCCMRMCRFVGRWDCQPVYTDACHCSSLSLRIYTDIQYCQAG
jgi:hypothetical protein